MAANTIVTYRALSAVFNRGAGLEAVDREMARALQGEAGEALSDVEAAAALASFSAALQEIEAVDPGDGVLSTPQNRLGSLLQSFVQEQVEKKGAEGHGLELVGGGREAKFDTKDWLGWAGSFFSWWRKIVPHEWHQAPPGAVPVDNTLRVGLLADWGTGLYGAPQCAAQLAADPLGYDVLMHLGDVYYAGTPKECKERFLPLWPHTARRANLALNGNHEMYSGGYGYFDVVLPAFRQMSPDASLHPEASYFALQNDCYTLIGLDTAFKDHDLTADQVQWLRGVVAAAGANRKIILFSHHQPYSLMDTQGPKLVGALGDLLASGRIFAWYWGHEHRLVIYDAHSLWGIRGRCIGHGGMPYSRDKHPGAGGDATALYRVDGKNGVPGGAILDGPNPYVTGEAQKYGPNGYVTLDFQSADLVETFHLPDGTVILEQPVR